jgi:hypothetical protein
MWPLARNAARPTRSTVSRQEHEASIPKGQPQITLKTTESKDNMASRLGDLEDVRPPFGDVLDLDQRFDFVPCHARFPLVDDCAGASRLCTELRSGLLSGRAACFPQIAMESV